MRLLTWNSQNELVLTDNGDKSPLPYAILSHTWGPEHEEVTFADVQNRQGQSKAGYAKVLFCGQQARIDKIEHFWMDTCCIDKPNELSEAITSMFRWYQRATKCYVYLSDVSVDKGDKTGDVQSTWESEFRRSRWLTRGWTLQELLAPVNVEFFSRQGEFLGTKKTLAQLIHQVTSIPVAALRGAPLTQFPIDEKIRWTERRQTTKIEDRAYCLLGIFNVFMLPNYGEGDNAFRRLRRKIDKHFGSSNVAAHLGDVGEVTSSSLCGSPTQPNGGADLLGRASDFDRPAQVSHSDGPRPAKRARTSYQTNFSGPEDSALHGNTVGSHMESTSGHIQQSSQVSRDVSAKISKERYETLVRSLLFERIDFRVNNVMKAMSSTCRWLFCHPYFQTWDESGSSAEHSGFLWIKGKPGCGKSTLMKALLRWAQKRKSRGRGLQTVVPYFFNARASASLEKSSLGLYRTVVHHLLSSCPQLGTLFAEKFALKDSEQLGKEWTVEELQDFLFDAVESNEYFGLCLLVDALDEAEYEDDVRHMIRFLVQLSDRASGPNSSCNLRICFSSRHYPHITITKGLSLVVEDQPEHGQDIDHYITSELTCHDGNEKDELRAEILNKSAGIFLWVVLVVQILNKLDDRGVSLPAMKTRLRSLPTNLKELFRDILMKSDVEIETSVRFFQWTLFCMRPLHPAEIFVAMQYSESPDDQRRPFQGGVSVPDRERLNRFILNCSRGLAEVVEVGRSQAAAVQFIHETVREFLVEENGLAMISLALAPNVLGISHQVLRIACFRCVSTNVIPEEYERYCGSGHKTNASLDVFRSTMQKALPFLDYAIEYLLKHAEQAQKNNISQQNFLKSQIDANGLWLDQHRLWWNVLERYTTRKVKHDVTLIYFVAERKYSHLLTTLLNITGANHTPCGKYGSALQVSSYNGSEDIVKTLLDKGADVNARGGYYGDAIHAAFEGGNAKIMQILLEKGTDINTPEDECNNLLYQALQRGREDVVRMLLARGANVNAQRGFYGNALQAASALGRDTVVQMLLDQGADVNAQGGHFGNALQAASAVGRDTVVQMLLDQGADVNAQGGHFGNALQAASAVGRDTVVQMLLDQGADVNAQGDRYGTALQAASQGGHEKVVKVLLDSGADVDAQEGEYGTALQAASRYGYETVVQTLLDRGADVNAQGGCYVNALQAALLLGHEKIVQILLDRGADVNAQGGLEGNAL